MHEEGATNPLPSPLTSTRRVEGALAWYREQHAGRAPPIVRGDSSLSGHMYQHGSVFSYFTLQIVYQSNLWDVGECL